MEWEWDGMGWSKDGDEMDGMGWSGWDGARMGMGWDGVRVGVGWDGMGWSRMGMGMG